MAVEKVNITMPKEILEQLRRLVPTGERSHAIAEATARYVEALAQKAAFRNAAGLWKDRTDIRTQADVNRMLKALRGSTRHRLKRLADG